MSKPFVFHGKDSCIVRCFHVHYVGYSTESEREKERKKEKIEYESGGCYHEVCASK